MLESNATQCGKKGRLATEVGFLMLKKHFSKIRRIKFHSSKMNSFSSRPSLLSLHHSPLGLGRCKTFCCLDQTRTRVNGAHLIAIQAQDLHRSIHLLLLSPWTYSRSLLSPRTLSIRIKATQKNGMSWTANTLLFAQTMRRYCSGNGRRTLTAVKVFDQGQGTSVQSQ